MDAIILPQVNKLHHNDRSDANSLHDIIDGVINVSFTNPPIASAASNPLGSFVFRALDYANGARSDARIAVGFVGASLYNERTGFNNAIKSYMISI